MVHFRKRLKEEGLEFLFSQSVSLHPKAKSEKEVQIDTTVQEKNITFPTDAKLAKKVIDKIFVSNTGGKLWIKKMNK